ncbi:MAG: trypsin-like peptidase domain-containing protein, partial [Bacilli bacterium]|nr:trypsin-like peptidase domain-containing protein [Bacilli bacterium]
MNMGINSLNDFNYQPPVNNNKKLTKTIVISVVVTAIVTVLIILLLFRFFPKLVGATVTNITKSEKEVTVNENGIADAVEKVYDSVVIIKTLIHGEVYASGTGFIYDKVDNTYFIMTNYHVIQGGDSVNVQFTNGLDVQVEVAGGDKYADIAVLKYTTTEELTLSVMGSSQSMRVGDTVFAIGAPLDSDVYSWSVTRGVLSGKDRKVEVSTNNGSSADWI